MKEVVAGETSGNTLRGRDGRERERGRGREGSESGENGRSGKEMEGEVSKRQTIRQIVRHTDRQTERQTVSCFESHPTRILPQFYLIAPHLFFFLSTFSSPFIPPIPPPPFLS
jgi:hypothetical protein